MLSLQLEKLHAIGFKPVLLLGKETRKKEVKCEILTPRCTLTVYAQDYLDKIGTFYEFLCEGEMLALYLHSSQYCVHKMFVSMFMVHP